MIAGRHFGQSTGTSASLPTPTPFQVAALGLGVFVCCLLGIAARLGMDLSNLWMANTLLLGMLLRFPALSVPWSWLTAALAFITADLVTGSSLSKTLILSAGNLVSVAVAWRLLSRLNRRDRHLQRPGSMWRLLSALAIAAAATAVIGAIAGPALFDTDPTVAAAFWFATELVNHLLVLPLLLTLPDPVWWRKSGDRARVLLARPWQLAPAASLLISMVVAMWIGDPVAVVFPLPALLWCALSYGMFGNACLIFGFGVWTLLAVPSGLLESGLDLDTGQTQLLFRLSVSLIMLVALTLASAVAARRHILGVLQSLAELDDLADLRGRRDFLQRTRGQMQRLALEQRQVSVMMVDIDRFNRLRDRHGHAGGEQMLVSFGERLRESLGNDDHAARIGGEEFAVMLPDCEPQRALQIAEDIRRRAGTNPIVLSDGTAVAITVSIGMTHCLPVDDRMDALLAAADLALYRAKAGGRDRVEMTAPIPAITSRRGATVPAC